MYFPSKRSIWFTAIAWGVMPLALIATLFQQAWPASPIVALALGLALWLWFDTGYTLTESELLIKSGPSRRRMPLSSIRKVRHSRNPLSAPALSLDRLEIRYGPRSYVLISPRDTEQFLALLKQRCPQAEMPG